MKSVGTQQRKVFTKSIYVVHRLKSARTILRGDLQVTDVKIKSQEKLYMRVYPAEGNQRTVFVISFKYIHWVYNLSMSQSIEKKPKQIFKQFII